MLRPYMAFHSRQSSLLEKVFLFLYFMFFNYFSVWASFFCVCVSFFCTPLSNYTCWLLISMMIIRGWMYLLVPKRPKCRNWKWNSFFLFFCLLSEKSVKLLLDRRVGRLTAEKEPTQRHGQPAKRCRVREKATVLLWLHRSVRCGQETAWITRLMA